MCIKLRVNLKRNATIVLMLEVFGGFKCNIYVDLLKNNDHVCLSGMKLCLIVSMS